MGYIDIKTIVWQRITFSEHEITAEELLAKAKMENNIVKHVLNNCDTSVETMFDTEEMITVEDNGNRATVELYTDKGKLLWDNTQIDTDND